MRFRPVSCIFFFQNIAHIPRSRLVLTALSSPVPGGLRNAPPDPPKVPMPASTKSASTRTVPRDVMTTGPVWRPVSRPCSRVIRPLSGSSTAWDAT